MFSKYILVYYLVSIFQILLVFHVNFILLGLLSLQQLLLTQVELIKLLLKFSELLSLIGFIKNSDIWVC